ncbi:hypothetical protein EMCRGX_G013346 [Ephydatia muelleri]
MGNSCLHIKPKASEPILSAAPNQFQESEKEEFPDAFLKAQVEKLKDSESKTVENELKVIKSILESQKASRNHLNDIKILNQDSDAHKSDDVKLKMVVKERPDGERKQSLETLQVAERLGNHSSGKRNDLRVSGMRVRRKRKRRSFAAKRADSAKLNQCKRTNPLQSSTQLKSARQSNLQNVLRV